MSSLARLQTPVRIVDQCWPAGTPPLVSIYCLAYNHAAFIRQTIEGFLMQETTFPVEIFIHDDASDDSTANIIASYADRYPNIFRISLQSENHWEKGVGYYNGVLKTQKGEFIAFCEGDDYWITPVKLEQQIAMLEENRDCSLCLHAVVDVDAEGRVLAKEFQPRPKPGLIAQGGYFRKECEHWQTAAFVIRKKFTTDLPDWVNHLAFGDTPLLALASLHGPICCISGIHAAYRIHGGGVFSNFTLEANPIQALKKAIRWENEFFKMYNFLIHEADQPNWIQFFKAKATGHAKSVIWNARLLSDYRQIRKSILDAVRTDPMGILKDVTCWKNSLFALLPWLDFKHAIHFQEFADSFKISNQV